MSARGARRRRSVRVVAALAYLSIVVVAIGLIVGVERELSRYNRGEETVVARWINPHVSPAYAADLARSRLRALNNEFLANPGRVPDRERLDALSIPESDLAIAVRVEGEIVYVEPDFTDSIEEGSIELPEFGEAWRAPSRRSPPPEQWETAPRPPNNRIQVLAVWDFITADGLEATFFVLRRPSGGDEVGPPRPPFNTTILIGAILAFGLLSAVVGMLILRSVLTPLGLLEAAALRFGHGDLDDALPLDHNGAREVEHVFDAFETMRRRLRDLLETQRRDQESRHHLIANLSHDLKTPITTIRGYLEGLQRGIADTSEKRERYLDTAIRRVGDLESMIRRLFELATLEANPSSISPKPVDMVAFLRDCVTDLETAFGTERIAIGYAWPPTAVIAAIDPVSMRRVMENLVENAVRHAGIERPTVTVGLELLDDRFRISVADNGHGIAEEVLEEVFERSARGDPDRSGAGTGLGLAISREIVRSHGGTITAVNDGGLVVYITLPRGGESFETYPDR